MGDVYQYSVKTSERDATKTQAYKLMFIENTLVQVLFRRQQEGEALLGTVSVSSKKFWVKDLSERIIFRLKLLASDKSEFDVNFLCESPLIQYYREHYGKDAKVRARLAKIVSEEAQV